MNKILSVLTYIQSKTPDGSARTRPLLSQFSAFGIYFYLIIVAVCEEKGGSAEILLCNFLWEVY